MDNIFTHPNTWGSHDYELAFIVQEADDQCLWALRNAIWSFPGILGCFLEPNREPAEQERFRADSFSDPGEYLRGTAETDFGIVPCVTSLVRGYDGDESWLYFGMPIAAIARYLTVGGFPFDDRSDLSWRDQVDHWLFRLAQHVFQYAPFDTALTGWTDVYGCTGGQIIPVPSDRWCGFIEPVDGRLIWHPPNQRAPMG